VRAVMGLCTAPPRRGTKGRWAQRARPGAARPAGRPARLLRRAAAGALTPAVSRGREGLMLRRSHEWPPRPGRPGAAAAAEMRGVHRNWERAKGAGEGVIVSDAAAKCINQDRVLRCRRGSRPYQMTHAPPTGPDHIISASAAQAHPIRGPSSSPQPRSPRRLQATPAATPAAHIVRRAPRDLRLPPPRRRLKLLEALGHCLGNLHEGCQVAWRREVGGGVRGGVGMGGGRGGWRSGVCVREYGGRTRAPGPGLIQRPASHPPASADSNPVRTPLKPTASVAVVGRAEHGHHRLLVAPIVALHDQLVCAADEVQAVGVVELLADVLLGWGGVWGGGA
jgi:hypothetical protein